MTRTEWKKEFGGETYSKQYEFLHEKGGGSLLAVRHAITVKNTNTGETVTREFMVNRLWAILWWKVDERFEFDGKDVRFTFCRNEPNIYLSNIPTRTEELFSKIAEKFFIFLGVVSAFLAFNAGRNAIRTVWDIRGFFLFASAAMFFVTYIAWGICYVASARIRETTHRLLAMSSCVTLFVFAVAAVAIAIFW